MLPLSICIPTYNRAPYLKECLESIAAASAGNWESVEIVVSDNASVDETASVVAGFEGRLPRLRYVRNEVNIGPARNFYAVAALGQGRHVWIVGDDDQLELEAISMVLRALRDGYGMLVCNYSVWDPQLKVMKNPKGLQMSADSEYQDAGRLMQDFHLHMGYLSSVVIERSRFFAADSTRRERFLDLGFSHMYSFYMGARSAPLKALSVAAPLIRNRSGNSGGFDWFGYFVEGSAIIFEALGKEGYSPVDVHRAKRGVLMKFLLPGLPWLKVSSHGSFNRQVGVLVSGYWREWRLWVLVLPLYCVPRFVWQLARGIRRRLRGQAAGLAV